MKLLQGLGVCVGCELLQANVKKYHGKGCVSYPICCSHRGYVGTLNCCKEKGHYIVILHNALTNVKLYHTKNNAQMQPKANPAENIPASKQKI